MDNQSSKTLLAGKILYAVVRTKDQVVYQGNVEAVTSYNEKGTFDVLPQHINFISLIKDRLVLHERVNQNKDINMSRGILKVFENKVFVYIVS
jgi:F0F1-type ATP synthase epsilon subunit